MIGFRMIEELMKIQNEEAPLISMYLDVDSSHYGKRDCENVIKDLVKEREKEILAFSVRREQKESIEKDLEKIRQFIRNEFNWKKARGLAFFASSAKNFWQVYSLPQPVKNVFILDTNPYIRPLVALFDEYRRFCMVMVDKARARIFEAFLGEIEELTDIVDEITRNPKTGGWKGNEENRIQRHIQEEVHRHYKRVANLLEDFSKKYPFDELILGGHKADLPEFERELSASLREKIVAREDLDLHASKEVILEKVMGIEKQVRKDQSQKMAERLNELAGERMAVTGLLSTLEALRKGQVHTLVISSEYGVSGLKCPLCGYLDRDAKECPLCRKTMVSIPDLIDDLIETGVDKGCKIEYVSDSEPMNQIGKVAAILRYKT